jgi:hypothetical protein
LETKSVLKQAYPARNKKDGLLGKKKLHKYDGELLKSSDKQSLTKQIFQFCSILNIDDIDTLITIIAVDITQGHFLIVNSILLLGYFGSHLKLSFKGLGHETEFEYFDKH